MSRKGLSYVLGENFDHENHILPINSIQFSCGELFTAGRDGTVKRILTSSPPTVESIDTDEHILQLETCISSQPVRPMYTEATYRILHSYNLHFDWINDVRVFGRGFATCSSDLSIKIVDMDTCATTSLPNVHTDYINRLELDGDRLFSAGLDGQVVLWDLGRMAPVQTFEAPSPPGSPSSIYSLAVQDGLVAAGGPSKTVNLYDTRQQRLVRRLVGHQDNVRALAVVPGTNQLVSGSSDATIKAWDLRTFSAAASLGVHNAPVYTLSVDSGSVYSGDRDGAIVKTDLVGTEFALSSLVAQRDSPVLSLCAHNGLLHSSDARGLASWAAPDTRKIAVYSRARAQQEAVEEEQSVEEQSFYEIISSLSVEVEDECAVESEEEYVSMFVDGQGGGSREFVNAYKNSNDGNPSDSRNDGNPSDSKNPGDLGNNSDSRGDQVNNTEDSSDFQNHETNSSLVENPLDSSSLVEFNQANSDSNPVHCLDIPVEILLNPSPHVTLIPFNSLPLCELPTTNKSMVSKRVFSSKRKVLVLYSNGDISIWDLLTCTETPVYRGPDGRKQMDRVFQQHQTDDTLNDWCDVEIKAGKLFVAVSENSFLNVEVYHDDLAAYLDDKTFDKDARYYLGVVFLDSLFADYFRYEQSFDEALRAELEPKKTRFREKMKSSEKKSEKGTGSTEKKAEKATTESAETTGVTAAEISSLISLSEKEVDPNSILRLLAANCRVYGERTRPGDSLYDSHEQKRPPTVRVPPSLHVTIYEHSHELGNYRDLFSFSVADLAALRSNPQLVHQLRTQLPRWIGLPLLYNKVPAKETPRVTFILRECDYSTLEPHVRIGGKSGRKIKRLPVSELSIKLTSHNMLRVAKVLAYLVDKFESKTPEVKNKQAPEDWLVLVCKGTELPANMTLSTIKTRIWKSSSDVELEYRRRFDPSS